MSSLLTFYLLDFLKKGVKIFHHYVPQLLLLQVSSSGMSEEKCEAQV